MDTRSLSILANNSDINKIDQKWTQLFSIVKDNTSRKQLIFTFTAPEVDNNTTVYKATAFDIVNNKTSISRYQGPKYILHNRTSGCSKLVRDSPDKLVIDSCLDPISDLKIPSDQLLWITAARR